MLISKRSRGIVRRRLLEDELEITKVIYDDDERAVMWKLQHFTFMPVMDLYDFKKEYRLPNVVCDEGIRVAEKRAVNWLYNKNKYELLRDGISYVLEGNKLTVTYHEDVREWAAYGGLLIEVILYRTDL